MPGATFARGGSLRVTSPTECHRGQGVRLGLEYAHADLSEIITDLLEYSPHDIEAEQVRCKGRKRGERNCAGGRSASDASPLGISADQRSNGLRGEPCLAGPQKWTWFHLYVIIEVFSRFVVGWHVATGETAALAQAMINTAIGQARRLESERGELTTTESSGRYGPAARLADLWLEVSWRSAGGQLSPLPRQADR